MPLEFSSITNIASALSRRRFQKSNRFAIVFSRYSDGMNVALQNNGFTKRSFGEEIVHRVQTVKVPDQSVFTADVTGVSGFDYQDPYKYTLTPDVNISIINDQFDRLRNVFVDWIRISTGIGSDGALSYRSQTSCDFSIIALDTNDKPLSGYTALDTIVKSVDGTSFDSNAEDLVKFSVGLSTRQLRRLNQVQAASVLAAFI